MRDYYPKRNILKPVFRLLVFVAFISVMFVNPASIYSQSISEIDEGWSQPINLSQSSGASNPGVVLDSSNTFHFFWEDIFRGFLYKSFKDDKWGDTKKVFFPFVVTKEYGDDGKIILSRMPQFVVDKFNRVHTLWQDDRNVLYHSIVPQSSFNNYDSWLPRQVISEAVVGMNIASDEEGNVHLVYIKSSTSIYENSGIYYRRLVRGGYWEESKPLFESSYFRVIDPSTANVSISTASSESGQNIYVVWNLPQLNRVYSIISQDGGTTWGDVFEVDGPSKASSAITPANIETISFGQQVVYTWQVKQPGAGCVQYYQNSMDGGATWSDRRTMLTDLTGCAQKNQFLVNKNGLIVLVSEIEDQVYLSIWDGENWSNPQLQQTLLEFVDPETLNVLTLESRQYILTDDNNLAVVGTGTTLGQLQEGDVWVTSRSLGTVEDWFTNQNEWSRYENITQSTLNVSQSVLTSDSYGGIHLFWVYEEQEGSDQGGDRIYYSRWDGKQWSSPVDILVSEAGVIGSIAAQFDQSQKLLLAWTDLSSNKLYFSSADYSKAINSREWSPPKAISDAAKLYDSVELAVGDDGVISIAYSIPVNEERGIYLTQSVDFGANWSEPVQVADALENNWVFVNSPQLHISDNKNYQIVFTIQDLPLKADQKTLYIVRSENGGKSWDIPQLMNEYPVSWTEMVGNEKSLYLVWQENYEDSSILISEVSSDGGQTWVSANPILNFDTVSNPARLVMDRTGNLNLVQFARDQFGRFILNHWILDGNIWYISETSTPHIDPVRNIDGLLLSATSSDGLMNVFSMGKIAEDSDKSNYSGLFYTEYKLGEENPELTAVASATPTIQQIVTVTVTDVPTFLATPTPEMIANADEGVGLGRTTNMVIGVGAGVIVSGLLVVIILAFIRKER